MNKKSSYVVHLWPVVPAAEKVTPLTARSISAEGHIMPALLPPSSKRFLPSLAETTGASAFPIAQLPVAENKAMFSFSANSMAASLPPFLIKTKSLWSGATSSQICLIRSAQPSA